MREIAKLVNTSNQTLTVNSNILFSDNTINTSSIGYTSDGTIQLKTPGIYQIWSNFDVAPVGTSAQVVLYEGGTPSPGAQATETVAAGGDTANLNINTVSTVRYSSGNSFATLSFKTPLAAIVSNANVIIEKI